MADGFPLPPGAELVNDSQPQGDFPLPPGAELVEQPSYAERARAMRKGTTQLEGHSGPSSHLMAHGEADGRYVAYPTLFQNETGEFYQVDDPFQEAKKRDEIFTFDTQQEARRFAEGAWKEQGGSANAVQQKKSPGGDGSSPGDPGVRLVAGVPYSLNPEYEAQEADRRIQARVMALQEGVPLDQQIVSLEQRKTELLMQQQQAAPTTALPEPGMSAEEQQARLRGRAAESGNLSREISQVEGQLQELRAQQAAMTRMAATQERRAALADSLFAELTPNMDSLVTAAEAQTTKVPGALQAVRALTSPSGGDVAGVGLTTLVGSRRNMDPALRPISAEPVAREFINSNLSSVEGQIRESEDFKIEADRKRRELVTEFARNRGEGEYGTPDFGKRISPLERLAPDSGRSVGPSLTDYVDANMRKWERVYMRVRKDELEGEIARRIRVEQAREMVDPLVERNLNAFTGSPEEEQALAVLRGDVSGIQREVTQATSNEVEAIVKDAQTKLNAEISAEVTRLNERVRSGEITFEEAQGLLERRSQELEDEANEAIQAQGQNVYDRQIEAARVRAAKLLESEPGERAMEYYRKAYGTAWKDYASRQHRALEGSYESLGLLNRFVVNVESGALEFFVGSVDGLSNLGLSSAMAQISAEMRGLGKAAEIPAYSEEFGVRSLYDPEWWEKVVARGVGTSAPSMIAGLATGGLGGTLIGSAVFTAAEAISEGGFTYRDALANGLDPEAARDAALKSTKLNMALLGLNYLQLGTALGISGTNRQFWQNLLMGAGVEGSQEILQEAINQYSVHGPEFDIGSFATDPNTYQAGVVGAIIGGGFQMGQAGNALKREMAIRANYDASAAAFTRMLIGDGPLQDLEARVEAVNNLIATLERRGRIDAEQAQRARDGIAQARELVAQIPEDLPAAQKAKAAGILLRINALETEGGSESVKSRLQEAFRNIKAVKPEQLAQELAKGMGVDLDSELGKRMVAGWIDETAASYMELLGLRLPDDVKASVQSAVIRLAEIKKTFTDQTLDDAIQERSTAQVPVRDQPQAGPGVREQDPQGEPVRAQEEGEEEVGRQATISVDEAVAAAQREEAEGPQRRRGVVRTTARLRQILPGVNMRTVANERELAAEMEKMGANQADVDVVRRGGAQVGGYYAVTLAGQPYIFVNLEEASAEVPWHEAIHPVLYSMARTAPGRAVVASLARDWQSTSVAPQVRTFLEGYATYDQATQDIEAVTQAIALMAEQATRNDGYGTLARAWLSGAVNKLFGRPVDIRLDGTATVKDMAAALTKAYRQGRELTVGGQSVAAQAQAGQSAFEAARDRVAPKVEQGLFARRNFVNPDVQRLEREYKRRNGFPVREQQIVASIDEALARRIADVYEQAEDQSSDPAVQLAYEALARETLQQWNAITEAGYRLRPWLEKGDPYANSTEMMEDVRDNKRLYFFLTEEGFGSEGDATSADNAMLRPSGITVDGKDLVYNDLFRAVHDFFGHAGYGNQFGAVGEENAWRIHSQMFSPQARSVMTTETRGQNSWVNYGPQMRGENGELLRPGDEGYLRPRDRAFAPQKNFIMPQQYVELRDVPAERLEGRFARVPAPLVDPKGSKTIPWDFKRALGVPGGAKANRPGGARYERAVGKLARALGEEFDRALATAETTEDQRVRDGIRAAAEWYSGIREKLFAYYGGFIDPFAQMLAATSAQQNVRENMRQATQILENFTRNEYDDILAKMHDYVLAKQRELAALDKVTRADIKAFAKDIRAYAAKTGLWIYDQDGNRVEPGINKAAALQALYGAWYKVSTGPKTRNFYLNLTGASLQATIDKWAARTVYRAIHGLMRGKQRYVIAPENERGVGQSDFTLAQDAMARAAADRGVSPDVMQATLWIWEKALWENLDLSVAEDANSFQHFLDTNIDRVFFGISSMTNEGVYRDGRPLTPPAQFVPDLKPKLFDRPGVKMGRIEETVGRYMGVTERSFDLQMITTPQADISGQVQVLADLARRTNQESFFVSVQVGKDNANARPAIEILLPTDTSPITIDDYSLRGNSQATPSAEAIMQALEDEGITGFTLQMNNGRPVAIQTQFIPEYDESIEFTEQVTAAADQWADKMLRLADQLKASGQIINYNLLTVSTQVYGEQEYARAGSIAAGIHSTTLGDEMARRAERLNGSEEGLRGGNFSRRRGEKLSPEQRQVRSALRKLIRANGGVLAADVDSLRAKFPTVSVADELKAVGLSNGRKFDAALRDAGVMPSDNRVTVAEKAQLRHVLQRQVKAALEGYRQGRADVTELQDAVGDFITTSRELINRLHPKLASGVLKRIARVRTPLQAERVIESLEKAIRSAYDADQAARRNSALERIEKMLDPATHTKRSASGVRKADLDPDTLALLPRIAAAMQMPAADAQARIDEIWQAITRDYQAGINDDMNPSAAQAQELFILGFAGAETMSAEELEAKASELKEFLKVGRAYWKQKEDERKARDRKMVTDVVESITGKAFDQIDFSVFENRNSAAKRWGRIAGISGRVAGLAWQHQSWISMGEIIGAKEGAAAYESRVHKIMVEPVIAATEMAKRTQMLWEQRVLDAQHRIFGAKGLALARRHDRDSRDRTWSWVDETGEPREVVMTTAQARKKWMEYQDPSLRPTFEAMELGESFIEMLERDLDATDLEWARWQLEFYQDIYPQVNMVYRQLFGVDMANPENYSPIRRRGRNATDEAGDRAAADLQDGGRQVLMTQVWGNSLKERVKNTSPLELVSDHDMLRRHISDQARFYAWAPTVRSLTKLITDRDFKDAVTQTYGSGVYDLIKKNWGSISLNYLPTGVDPLAKTINKMRSAVVTSVLAIKPTIAFKQILSFPAYAAQMPAREWISYYVNPRKWGDMVQSMRDIKAMSTFMEARGMDFDRDLRAFREAMDEQVTNATAHYAMGKLINALMLPTRFGDRAAIYLGGAPVFDYWMKRTGGDVDTAMAKFELATRMAQQSTDMVDLDMVQRGSALHKLFTTYMTSPLQYLRQSLMGLHTLVESPTPNIKQAAKQMVMFWSILPGLYTLASTGIGISHLVGLLTGDGPPDEEKTRDSLTETLASMAIGNLTAPAMVGPAADMMIEMLPEFFGGEARPWITKGIQFMPVLDEISETALDLRNTLKQLQEDDFEVGDFVAGLAATGSVASGLPLMTTTETVIDVSNPDKELAYKIMRLLGYTDYVADVWSEAQSRSSARPRPPQPPKPPQPPRPPLPPR